MASFLSGLMGGLEAVGKGVLGSALGGKGAGGLMGAILPAIAGTPGGASAPAGAGGVAGALTDIGVPSPTAPLTQAVSMAKPGFFQRINTVDPTTGMSFVDKLDKFGARLSDIDDGGNRAAAVDTRASDRLSKLKQAQMSALIDQTFAGDENAQMRFLLKSNPEAATKALADVYKSRNEAANVGAGDTRVYGDPSRGGSTFMAPKYGEADGVSYKIGPDGFKWGDQRPRTYSEAEEERHNRESERLGFGQLGVSRGNLGVARDRLNFDRSKEAGSSALPPLPPGFRRVQ